MIIIRAMLSMPFLKRAWVRDGHGKLSSLVTQIWLLLFARLCENLVNRTGEHYFERCLCLISIWLEEDRTVSLSLWKTVAKESVKNASFEESESTPPT